MLQDPLYWSKMDKLSRNYYLAYISFINGVKGQYAVPSILCHG